MKLSASKLNLMRACPLCFWKAYARKVVKPRGIMASLPGGMDRVIKTYFDLHRITGLVPAEIKAMLPGKLFPELAKLNRWRHWKSGLTVGLPEYDVELIGAIDDCLVSPEGALSPLDYKTKGSKPKTDGSEYYQLQLDIYDLMFQENGYETTGKAYLAYFYPKEGVGLAAKDVCPEEMLLKFGIEVYELETNADRAREAIKEAVTLLKGPMPDPAPDCELCDYITLTTALKTQKSN